MQLLTLIAVTVTVCWLLLYVGADVSVCRRKYSRTLYLKIMQSFKIIQFAIFHKKLNFENPTSCSISVIGMFTGGSFLISKLLGHELGVPMKADDPSESRRS